MAVTALALAWLGLAAPVRAQAPGSDGLTYSALQLLRRATFGVRPADVEAVKSMGIEAWLDRQLEPSGIDDGALEARLARFPAASKSITELVRDYSPKRPRPGDTARDRRTMTAEERRMRAATSPVRIVADLTGAKLVRAVWSERQLEEVMTDFWFNHFNVFFGKGLDRYLVGDYERTAIRPYVFGRFEDMLLATAKHPAMLFYLDNWTSFAPDSMSGARQLAMRREMVERLRRLTPRQRERMIRSGRITRDQLDRMQNMMAQRPDRRRGINENYARELMELHTLGVDGGYTQGDVIAVARAFTGWTFVPPANRRNAQPNTLPAARRPGAPAAGTFDFRMELHDTEQKTVLGHVLPAGRGMEDGMDVIHLLATSPATAHHIATELIRSFVSDSPDPAFVDEIAKVFHDTDGDLRAVTRALFVSPRFYDASNVGSKVKSPFELVASALRVTHAEIGPSPRLVATLRDLGELPYNESAPTGYPLASQEWVNSGAMLNRMNFALELATGRFPGLRLDGRRIARAANVDPDAAAGNADIAIPGLIDTLMPGLRTDALVATIRADLTEQVKIGTSSPRALGVRAIGLVLGSPDFQRK